MHEWTYERVELLRKLWVEGKSASQIAEELGEGVTRNAVIGKVHRLKIAQDAPPRSSRSPSPRKKSDTPRQKKSSTKSVSVSQRAAVRSAARIADAALEQMDSDEIVEDIPFELPPTDHFGSVSALMGREESQCRWPVGDVFAKDFRLCGHSVEGKDDSYCKFHTARAYKTEERPKRSASGMPRSAPRQLPNFF